MGPTSLPYIFFSMWQVLLLIESKPFLGWTFQIMILIVLTCLGRVSFLGFRFRGSRVLPRNRLLRTRRQSGTRTCPWSRPSHRKSGSNQASRSLKRIFLLKLSNGHLWDLKKSFVMLRLVWKRSVSKWYCCSLRLVIIDTWTLSRGLFLEK